MHKVLNPSWEDRVQVRNKSQCSGRRRAPYFSVRGVATSPPAACPGGWLLMLRAVGMQHLRIKSSLCPRRHRERQLSRRLPTMRRCWVNGLRWAAMRCDAMRCARQAADGRTQQPMSTPVCSTEAIGRRWSLSICTTTTTYGGHTVAQAWASLAPSRTATDGPDHWRPRTGLGRVLDSLSPHRRHWLRCDAMQTVVVQRNHSLRYIASSAAV